MKKFSILNMALTSIFLVGTFILFFGLINSFLQGLPSYKYKITTENGIYYTNNYVLTKDGSLDFVHCEYYIFNYSLLGEKNLKRITGNDETRLIFPFIIEEQIKD